jgi:hypothetical protein
MQIFNRNNTSDLVIYYEHFLMNFNWSDQSVPHAIGDWLLIKGFRHDDLDGMLILNAIYRCQNDDHYMFIYIELTEQLLVKMVVSDSQEEIMTEVSLENPCFA